MKIVVKIWKSLGNFFMFDYKIFSEIDPLHKKMHIFRAGFSDARMCVKLNFFCMTLEKN